MPLRRQSIELDALAAIERVRKNHPSESDLVELKTEWIDPAKAARRLAAHANAARGEPILWLIGVDEKKELVPGVLANDFADWWAQVQSKFDGPSPDITSVPIGVGDVTVMALAFATDRAPYIFLTQKDPYSHEVPWRDGTRTRSATREEILRMLIPVQQMPLIELLVIRAQLFNKQTYVLEITFYVEPITNEAISFPHHRCTFGLGYRGSNAISFTQDYEFGPKIAGIPGACIVGHPSRVMFSGEWDALLPGTSSDLIAEITLAISRTDKTKRFSIPLSVATETHELTTWRPIISMKRE